MDGISGGEEGREDGDAELSDIDLSWIVLADCLLIAGSNACELTIVGISNFVISYLINHYY